LGTGGQWESVDAERLEVDDTVEIRDGERLPADGQVVGGRGFVDASALTGESVPLHVQSGSVVQAGTSYRGEALRVRVSAVGGATRVGQLARRIVDAGGQRPRLQRTVDRLTGHFSAAVLLTALFAAIGWWFVDPAQVLPVTIALLVISCPCALGLATPVVLAIARARAARSGLLLHNPEVIEALGEVDRVVLDKTGTLTSGAPSVRWADLPPRLWRVVSALEEGDGHPLAQAIARWGKHPRPLAVEGRIVHPGRGMEGRVSGQHLRIGSPSWLGVDSPQGRWGEGLSYCVSRAWTPVAVELEGKIVGLVGVGDTLRPEAPQLLAALCEGGLEPVIASGDHPEVVAAIARELGIAEHHGAMSPEEKAELVADGRSWMIGDGINDAPALRAARVGLAMGGGAEVALEVADATALEEGLSPALRLFQGARRARRAVRRNLAFALTYNLLFATLAVAGLVTPLVAAIIMPFSSITVLFAAMWTRSFDAHSRAGEPGAEASAQKLRPALQPAASASAP
jgi:Cu2+-exporting ATPase